MTLSVLCSSYAQLLAVSLSISGPITEPPKTDPYYMPSGAVATPTMPKVIIRNIRQDRAGNIWFATFAGPIRYDSKEFRDFSQIVGLPQTRVFSLIEDRSGALWFGSITDGVSRYDGKSFTKFTVKDGLAHNDVLWIFEDRDANIWFGTAGGVSRYDGKVMTKFTTKDGLVHNSVYTITQDAAGRIWFGTQGGICSYDGKSFSNFADQVGRSFVNIRSSSVDRSGNLWFGGQEGAFRYDGKTLTTFTSKDGLLDDFVGSMIVDRAGTVWLGHPGHFPNANGGGATRYDGKSFQHFTQKDGLNSTNVYCMHEDKAGNIWFGSVDAGACRYDGKTFTNFSENDPPPMPSSPVRNDKSTIAKGTPASELSGSIWSVFQAKNNDYWFGSDGQGAFRYDGKTVTKFTTIDGLSDDKVRGIQEDKSGNIYINTCKGINKFDGHNVTTLVPAFNVSPMSEWKLQPDDLWFAGAQNSGLVYRFDGKTLHALAFPTTKRGDDHYRRIPRDKFPNAKYTPYDVYTIYKDRRGSLWFGTADLGVCRFDGASFDWLFEEHLTNVAGGGSFGIRSIIEDNDGKFWFCNTQYRFQVDPNNANRAGTGEVSYKQEKGMGDLTSRVGERFFYFPSIVSDQQGDLWMATYRGGVWRYDGKSVTNYPVKDGSRNAWIVSINRDNQGNFWLGTNDAGAFKFNGKSFERFRP